jgi:RNA polymerase sigma-70 factor, ECF subfamily
MGRVGDRARRAAIRNGLFPVGGRPASARLGALALSVRSAGSPGNLVSRVSDRRIRWAYSQAREASILRDRSKQHPVLTHSRYMRAEGEVVMFPAERVEARARFDEFFEDEHEHLFKALYFVTGNRQDAEELMQDAFMKLWERWDQIERMSDPTGYLFRVALNGFRMRRRRAATAIRRLAPVAEERDLFAEAETRADVRRLLLGLTIRQRAALLLVDLLGYPSEQAARILRVRPSTVRALATQGRRALRAKEGARDA